MPAGLNYFRSRALQTGTSLYLIRVDLPADCQQAEEVLVIFSGTTPAVKMPAYKKKQDMALFLRLYPDPSCKVIPEPAYRPGVSGIIVSPWQANRIF